MLIFLFHFDTRIKNINFKYKISREKLEPEQEFETWNPRSLAWSSTNSVILVQLPVQLKHLS